MKHILQFLFPNAVSHSHSKKAPSQSPVSFANGEQQGGAYGSPQSVPDKLAGGPQRGKVYGGSGGKKK